MTSHFYRRLIVALFALLVPACVGSPEAAVDGELASGAASLKAPPRADVYVYDGPHKGKPGTTCPDCATAIVDIAKAAGYSAQRVYADQITTANLNATRLFVWPGGGDDSDATFVEFQAASAPNHVNVTELKAWVRGGGRYLGVCMGAFLAAHTPPAHVFDLLNGADANGEAGDADLLAHAANIRFATDPNRLEPVYYQAGPFFDATGGQEIWARYETTGHIAAMINAAGLGTVGVVGTHFEATHGWYSDCTAKTGAEWAACASLPGAQSNNHAFIKSFLRRVITR